MIYHGDNRKPIVVWTATDINGKRKILCREKNISVWNDIVSFGNNVDNCNVSGIRETNNSAIITWTENNGANSYYVKVENGVVGYQLPLLESGSSIQLVEGVQQLSEIKPYILKTNTLPYEIKQTDYVTTLPSSINYSLSLPVGTYTFTDNLTVEKTGSLTIAPGSTIKFAPGKKLLVKGSLNAVGTSSQPITFTSTTTSKWY